MAMKGRRRTGLALGGVLLAACTVLITSRPGAPNASAALACGPRAHVDAAPSAAGAAGGSCSGGGTPLAEGEVPEGCRLFRRACVDQGAIVLFNSSLTPDKPEAWRPHSYDPGRIFNFPFPAWAQGLKNLRPCGVPVPKVPPLPLRPATSLEPTPDLQAPQFSQCVVPLVLHLQWPWNYSHTWQGLSWLFTQLRLRGRPGSGSSGDGNSEGGGSDGSWGSGGSSTLAGRVQVLLATPLGLGMQPYYYSLFQPLSAFPVQTFADFSSRNVAHGRCFDSILVCAGPASESPNVYRTAQFVADHYKQQQQQQQQQPQAGTAALPLPFPQEPSAATAVGQRRLRVVFHARAGGARLRLILNEVELLQACNEWTYFSAASQTAYSATCVSWVFTDVSASIQVAQQADVYIGMHGANIANAWFLRPGSSMIEIHLPGYKHSRMHGRWNAADPASGVLWFNLHIKDLSALSPGEAEERRLGCARLYGRDKNAVVRWGALAAILERIADLGGDVGRYRAEGPEAHNFDMLPA